MKPVPRLLHLAQYLRWSGNERCNRSEPFSSLRLPVAVADKAVETSGFKALKTLFSCQKPGNLHPPRSRAICSKTSAPSSSRRGRLRLGPSIPRSPCSICRLASAFVVDALQATPREIAGAFFHPPRATYHTTSTPP